MSDHQDDTSASLDAPTDAPTGAAPEPRGDPEPAWVAELRKEFGQIRKEVAKVSRRSRGQTGGDLDEGDPPGQASQSAPSSDGVREQVQSAMKYAQVQSGLTDGQRETLSRLEADGLSYEQLTTVAEGFRQYGSRAKAAPPAADEARAGATPDSITQMSYAEFQQLGAKARAGDADALRKHEHLMKLIREGRFNPRELK